MTKLWRPAKPIVSLESYLHSRTIFQGYILGFIFENNITKESYQQSAFQSPPSSAKSPDFEKLIL